MTLHTPGPHEVVSDGRGNRHIVSRWAPDATTEARWTFLAEVKTPPPGTVLYKNGEEHIVQKGEDEANANLFASAHKLLSLIEDLVELEDGSDLDRDTIHTVLKNRARVLIVEARTGKV